ncbi:hypothetical protein [Actinomadura xylanilytica]|uniref:hypothetical protein n=1 Tax=Actinomadura xylanilytica TaxID=887459 RepID=UPI00255B2E4F|nr:hypothetical protein [Actinomadura xylanilytica]MDL4770605.1 hypothetical protein [Actinomadura xylanilytica]
MTTEISANDHGIRQFARKLGLSGWQVRLGWEQGMLPGPDLEGGRWSARVSEECAGAAARIAAAFGADPPIGAGRAADRVAAALGLDVERADIEMLVAHGRLKVISRYRDYPVYLLRDLDGLDPGSVSDIVAARKGKMADTVDARSAAKVLGWPKRTFERIAAERDLAKDQLGRYALPDVRGLGADQGLADRVREDRRLAALAKARREEAQIEDVVRGWLLRCTAYVDRDVDEPPETAPATRALRALAEARAVTGHHAL